MTARVWSLAAACATALIAAESPAATCRDAAGHVESVQGTVEVRDAGTSAAWRAVARGDALCVGDVVRVGRRSRADVRVDEQSVLRLRAQTELTLEGRNPDDTTVVDMARGAAHFFSRSGDGRLDVETPFTVAGVRGTEFLVEVGEEQAELTVFEGRVLAQNDAGNLLLSGGQSAVARSAQAPALRIVLKPRDATQWTLYYPPVLELDASAYAGPAGRSIRSASEAAKQGDITEALAMLDGVDPSPAEAPRFFAYKASLLLAVGSVDEARAELDRAAGAENGDVLALQSIIALTQNDEETALELARRAVDQDGDSVAATIALSYVQQARFDLVAARGSAEQATRMAPTNALAWARLAELQSSFGDTAAALRSATRARDLDPDLARTHMILGFAKLTRVDTAGARAAFERAIELDPADPLSFLGLGLAKIREGQLEEGGRDIEVAASLDSSSSVVRSYLGKTYYEEKRTGLDEREYAVAKELDPNDPTPWFYEAITFQTTNRPVQALRSSQRSIELNDDRAVYRSSLLLDSDLAARSAALGRVYGDLGFQRLALVEAWKSVNTDPTNFSAQRLMADSYAAEPRHEIARVSSLLQSQLLQPINIQPVQPRLAESNLFLISSQGASTASFNELNPLFNRDRVALQAEGLAGSDDTYAGEGVVSAVNGRFSVSGGYAYGETQGFRPNNDKTDEVGSIFMQAELTPATSVQAEYRYNELDFGAQEIRLLNDHSIDKRQTEESNTGRLGFRHSFSPGAVLLASYIYRDRDSTLFDLDPFMLSPFSQKRHESAQDVEGQLLLRARTPTLAPLESVNAIVGGGYVDLDVDQTDIASLPFPPFTSVSEFEPDVSHGNFYLYTLSNFTGGVTITSGLSVDYFDEEGPFGVGEVNQVNPKFGFQWNPGFVDGMTVRAAAFRMLKRTLVTDATLEPTQVAGFNQFYDDPDGTIGWRYGGAIDQKFSDCLFGGVEFSKRDLEIPVTTLVFLPPPPFPPPSFAVTQFYESDEYLARVYGFATPFDWVSLRIEYNWEKFERDPDALIEFTKVETQRVPLGIQLFHPSGLSASFGATWTEQDGDFWPVTLPPAPVAGDREFWVFDAALRYRLPKRFGFLSFGIDNFLDKQTPYQASDLKNPRIRPGRYIFGAVSLSLP